jgi:transposase
MRSLRRFFRILLGLQGVIVKAVEWLEDQEAVAVRVRRHGNAGVCCGRCGTPLTGTLTTHERRWRHLDLMRTRAYLVATVHEGYCGRCGRRRVERVPWAAAGAKHTRVFDREVARLAQVADREAASRIFGVAWRTVGGMVKRVVDEMLPKRLLSGLRGIAVDETSHKRGHRYLTVVSDLLTGRVVWIGEGKSGETLEQFFAALGRRRARALEVVAMDMSGGYEKAVRARAPNADIVFDRFHVVNLLTKAIDEIRREACRGLAGDERRGLKRTRFSLLRNPARYTHRDHEAIERVRRTNGRLYRAYQLRVDFEHVWTYVSEAAARRFLRRWTRRALLSRREPLRRFAHTVRQHLDGILGFIRWGGLTNAVAEGINNKIRLIIHRSFGFHSVPALMSMIYLCCSGITLE